MSRKPGIARDFFEFNKEKFLIAREVDVSTPKGGRKIRSTKYFDKFLDLDYPTEREEYKESAKKHMEIIKEKKLQQTDLSYLEMLEVSEDIKKKRIEGLPRKEI